MCQKGGAVTDGDADGALGVLWVFELRLGVGGPSRWLRLGSVLFASSWLWFDWKERSMHSVRVAGGSALPEAPALLLAWSLGKWNRHMLLALRSLDSRAMIV